MNADLKIMLVSAFLVVILPIVPAYLLYRVLPSRTRVSGPFKGLTIQLTGAFGGYFVVALLILGFITTYLYYLKPKLPKYEEWTIEGHVQLEQAEKVEGVMYAVKPPRQDTDPNGHFVISRVPLEREKGKKPSSLILQKDQYYEVTISLKEKHKPSAFEKKTKKKPYIVKYDYDNKIIAINSIDDPIFLKKKPPEDKDEKYRY